MEVPQVMLIAIQNKSDNYIYIINGWRRKQWYWCLSIVS
jgi:hypothetical protein